MAASPIFAPSRHSPCIGVCQIDDASGLCLGCARTRNEISQWIAMQNDEREAVWAALPGRFESLSVRVRLMPWTASEIADWIISSIDQRSGTWVTGAPGAVAEFPCTSGREVAVERVGEAIIAKASDAMFRLRISEKLRAFAFDDEGPIVFGLPSARAAMTTSSTIQDLGDDTEAIDPKYRQSQLYDFGIGRKASRFCVRTSNDGMIAAMRECTGRHWSEAFASIGRQLIEISPHRVVETAAARIEVFAPIPPPGGTSPDGAHTHFLPAFLASGEEIPQPLALPNYALPVAIFYPTHVKVND